MSEKMDMNHVACLISGIEGKLKQTDIAQIKEGLKSQQTLCAQNLEAKKCLAKYLGMELK